MRLAVAAAVAAACGSPPPAAGPSNTASAAGRPLVFRYFQTGLIMSRSTLTTYTLRRDGERATLEVATQQAKSDVSRSGEPDEVGPWQPGKTTLYTGTARPARDGLALDLAAGAETLALDCRWVEVEVAGAVAVRVRSWGDEENDCGDKGTWSPKDLSKQRALGCQKRPTPEEAAEAAAPPPDDPEEARWQREQEAEEALRTQLTFGDGAGLEYLFVNDDCLIQGGGLRRIPADGSIGKIRGAR